MDATLKRRRTVLISAAIAAAAIAIAAIAVVLGRGIRSRIPSCDKVVDETKPSFDRSAFPPMPALDPKAEESFRPPDNWKPKTELAENVSIAPPRLSEVLRIAHVAKRGMKYSPEKPIRVEMQDDLIAVRFPSGAPPGGRRLRWSVHVLLDAETLQPVTVYQDPN